MGMTIDKAVERLDTLHFEQDDWNYGKLTEDCLLNMEALRLAKNTIRKYQKIEQILKDIPYGGDVTVRRIQEVVEDGNKDDN